MNVLKSFPAALPLIAAAACSPAPEPKMTYPETRKGDLVEDYHGTKIADPCRWMEDLDSKEVADWVARQNEVTFGYLDKLPMRAAVHVAHHRALELSARRAAGEEGGRYFYQKNTGLQRQSPLFVRASLTSEPALVIDPNVISPDGSLSLSQWSPSPDGKLLAYAISEGGADWETLHVREVDSTRDLGDEVKWVRFSNISWTNDSKGLFTRAIRSRRKGKVLEAKLSGQALYYHRVGTPQSDDRLIYERTDMPTWFVSGTATEDGRYLLIFMAKGSDNNNRLYYADLGDPSRPSIGAPVKPLVEDDDAEFNAFGTVGSTLYLRTDRSAPNRKVIAIDVRHPAPSAWKTVVPEAKEAIESVTLIGGRIVAQYLVDVQSKLSLFGLDGERKAMSRCRAPEPSPRSAAARTSLKSCSRSARRFSQRRSSRYDPAAKTSTPFEAPTLPIDVSQFETKQLFAPSKDGTKVPFFLTARKGLTLDGSHPTMLYGYGGFSISTLPTYRADVPAWLEMRRHLGDGEHARRRRVRRIVAQGRISREKAERLRRLHRRCRIPGEGKVRRRRSWASWAARTADCWLAR